VIKRKYPTLMPSLRACSMGQRDVRAEMP